MTEGACSPALSPHPDTFPDNTRSTLDYTYSLDRWSCVRQVYFVHLVFAYLVFFSGLFCLASRVYPPLHPWHALGGRLYILSMLWCMGTSLLVHNVGLPEGVLVSFLIVLLGMTVGWGCVKLHQGHMQQEVGRRVDEMVILWLSESKVVEVKEETEEHITVKHTARTGSEEMVHKPAPLAAMMMKARSAITSERGIAARIFSYKAAHGALMFMSWVNIAGRIGSSDQKGDFACYTYPVYKQLDSPKFPEGLNTPLTYVPIKDSNYGRLPWSNSIVAWGLELSILPLVGGLAIGGAMAYYEVRYLKKKTIPLSPPLIQRTAQALEIMPKINPRLIWRDA